MTAGPLPPAAGSAIWDACNGAQHIGPLSGTLSRLVESQQQVATLGYVDTLEEQALLEDMLERVKPAYPDPQGVGRLHYLLKTPFRYPPLAWGSRFGRVHEPGIFYGGGDTAVTLAETAYYRFVFWHAMLAPPVKDSIRSEHTLFTVGYRSQRGIRLHEPPFADHADALAHPQDYSRTQQLGSAMRAAGVEAFTYRSARAPDGGTCVGLFTPGALAHARPQSSHQWLCEVDAATVKFRRFGDTVTQRFTLSDFLVNGRLPMPA